MKRAVKVGAAILGGLLLVLAWFELAVLGGRWEIFLIRKPSGKGWMVIEQGNPRCGSLAQWGPFDFYEIPEDGYLCLSQESGAKVLRSLYLAKRPGRFSLIDWDQIAMRGVSEYQKEGCDVRFEEFFVGSGDELSKTSEGPVFMVQARHPECR